MIMLLAIAHYDETILLGDILRTVLALYMDDEDLPLPTMEEVLICNSTTTAEDVFYCIIPGGGGGGGGVGGAGVVVCSGISCLLS